MLEGSGAVLVNLKKLVENIPEPVGRLFVVVPFSWRLGPQYARSKKEILRYQRMTSTEQQEYVLARMRSIVENAYRNNALYRAFYHENGFTPDQLEHFGDIKRIPIVSKALLRQYPLEERSALQSGRMLINTGNFGRTTSFLS